jgi:methylphosphotriester-DNA--protein-cysteine methyltransferase
MIYECRAAPEGLARQVECIWSLRGSAGEGEAPPERILPDGRVEIVLNLGDAIWQHEGDAVGAQPAEMVVGPTSRPVWIRPTGEVDVIGIRFRHGGAQSLLGVSLAELADRVLPLGDVGRVFAGSFRDQLWGARGPRRIELLDRALLRRARAPTPRDEAVALAARLILSSHGRLGVTGVAAAVGMGARHLVRRFDAAVGVGPKTLARLARFHSLLRVIAVERPRTLAAAAAGAGYVDQSHLGRDFRDFTGDTPSGFLRSRHDLSALFFDWER